MGDSLWLALAFVLILEGVLPFAAPAAWRRMFTELLKLEDGQIRFFGLLSVVSGLLLWWILG